MRVRLINFHVIRMFEVVPFTLRKPTYKQATIAQPSLYITLSSIVYILSFNYQTKRETISISCVIFEIKSQINKQLSTRQMWAKVGKRVDKEYQQRQQEARSSDESERSYSGQDEEREEKHYGGQRYNHHQSSSSQSQEDNDSEHQQQSKPSTHYKKQLQQHSDSSDDSSQQEDEQDSLQHEPIPKNAKLQSLQQDSNQQQQDQQEEESIDYIEQRIRKLQKDLQVRLNKHQNVNSNENIQLIPKKQQQSLQVPPLDQGKIVSVIKKQPPAPPKRRESTQQDNSASLPQTQINFKAKQKVQSRTIREQQPKEEEKKEQENETIINKKKVVKQGNLQSSNMHKKPQPTMTVTSPVKAPKKKSKVTPIAVKSQIPAGKTNAFEKQFKRLNKQITELKKQNKSLKEELTNIRKKKKPIEEVQKLKELSQHDTKKLQKQLQLLKVLERLQTKLKNSIQRKLGKGSAENKLTKQAALLHKGLPSNILG